LQRTVGNRAVTRLVAAERVLARDPDKDLADAVSAEDWAKAAGVLAKLGQADALKKLKGYGEATLSKLDTAGAAALSKDDALTLHRRISFIQHAPADAVKHAAYAKVNKAGKLEDTTDVAGGKVEVHTGVDYDRGSENRPSGFSMAYTGTDAGTTRWLQFIWREMVVERAKQKPTRLDAAVTSTAKSGYRLTTDPDKPNYNTDTASATSPFYEAGFVNNRTDDSTTMFDFPAPMTGLLKSQFQGDDKATKVTSRAHFTTYLVRGMDVLYSVKTDVEWVFTSADEPARTQSTRAAGKVGKLDAAQRARLIEQYPNYDYLP
jgi:hypothetical protein